MAIAYVDFSRYEFLDRHGITRSTCGASTNGVFEFAERMAQIQSILDATEDEKTWQEIYFENKRLQFLIKKCLKLNGIKPKWCNLEMVEALLFRNNNNPGALVSLNAPKGKVQGGKPTTREEIIAAISTHVPLTEAIALAETVPAQQLQAILTAKNDLVKQQDPELKAKAAAKSNKEKAREQIEQMRKQAVTNGHV